MKKSILVLLSVPVVFTTLSAQEIFVKVVSLSSTGTSKEKFATQLASVKHQLKSIDCDVYMSDYGTWKRVYAGPFISEDKAKKALKKIKNKFHKKSYILRFDRKKSLDKPKVAKKSKPEPKEEVIEVAVAQQAVKTEVIATPKVVKTEIVATQETSNTQTSAIKNITKVDNQKADYKKFEKPKTKDNFLSSVDVVMKSKLSSHTKVKKDSHPLKEKVTLKGNMIVKYNLLPSSVDNLYDAFAKGMFYGRLRTNNFMWDWNADSKFDNKAMGIGGSLVYKTAPLAGFSTTLGFYTSQNPSFFREDAADVGSVKAGKDTFSRNKTKQTGNFGMSVLGQSYLQYDVSKTSFKLGRQLFETVFTKSNDTKMIPNAFDGVSATIKEIPKTTIQLAYFSKQKLRDHTKNHDVIAVDSWDENDDSAVNKNLTVARVGKDNSLIVGSITNKSVKNLKVNLSYALVPSIVSNLTFESHYAIPVGKWKVVPGIRYMQQFDALNASYDVANLKKNSSGYTDPQSLDSNLLALRLDIKNEAFLARLGYSQIADEADIVAPWRGFPTGGFTRAMAQYNWYANTKTYMARVGYRSKVDGFSVMARYAIQDFDDNKAGVQADTNIIHIDIRQNFGKNTELKVRLGFVSDEDETTKSDVSYNEYRVELNYFF